MSAWTFIKPPSQYPSWTADLGGSYFDRIHSDGLKLHLVKRLEQLGHKVTLEPIEAAKPHDLVTQEISPAVLIFCDPLEKRKKIGADLIPGEEKVIESFSGKEPIPATFLSGSQRG